MSMKQTNQTKLGFEDLRRKHRVAFRKHENALTHGEARNILEGGNEGHQQLLKRFRASPDRRFDTILEGNADYVHVHCSDSRSAVSDHESETHVGMQIRVAGNVIVSDGASAEETRESFSLVKKGGLILLTSHTKCGAVAAHTSWENDGRPDPGNEELSTLLTTVEKTTPEGNLIVQTGRATMLLDGQHLVTGHYDWDSGNVSFHNHPSVRAALLLKGNMQQYHNECNDGKLFELISNGQRPHSIVVSYHKLPFSSNTIFKAEPGEIFTTTGSEGGMDSCDRASLLYAVEHCGSRHIAMLAPNIRGVEQMFAKWEQDIRRMVVGGTRMFEEHLQSGAIAITKYVYDLREGKLDRS